MFQEGREERRRRKEEGSARLRGVYNTERERERERERGMKEDAAFLSREPLAFRQNSHSA